MMAGTRRSATLTLASAVAAVAAACGDGGRADTWVGTVDTVAGVPVVRNPADPVVDSSLVELVTVWRSDGPGESDGAPIWEQPRFLTFIGDAVYVLDSGAHAVHRLDAATGEWLGHFGREGGGPGELLRPVDVVPWRGAVGVQDMGHRSIERFGPDGSHLGRTQFNAMIFTLAPTGDTTAVVTAMGLETDEGMLVGDSIRPHKPASAVAGQGALLEQCERFSSAPGRVIAFSCVVPHLLIQSPGGELLREVAVDMEAKPRPEEEIDAFIARIRPVVAGTNMPAAQVDQFLAQQREAERYRRAMRTVRWDKTNRRYVLHEQESENFGSGPATFHVFDEDGVYLARFGLAESIWDFAMVDGDVVALVRDGATGLVAATRLRVGFPSATGADDR